ncbi:class A beta-lactamase-related serine hydrolase [Erwinia endophytica]|uniref:serine hydrolase domain-containing protein n=1 Tax=Erwinia endophytica TaxID=1563158 RepID=UPI001265FF9C|nr:serine hydrolase domain-containing protein [Erwinia endophytica]KAB8313449.1 class A beta-lactamase-related serine hydrolase [Erwinia endophytica]
MTLNWQHARQVAEEITAGWGKDGAPGGAIALFDADNMFSISCGGLADLAQGTVFDANTVVRFASITKHIFAALVTGYCQQTIGLEDKLAQHLPQLQGENGQVTVGQALDMTSGLPDVRETLSLLGLSVYNATSAASLLTLLSDLGDLNYPPGSEVSYSNTGYRLVEEALKAKGILFDDLIQQHINQPLGLRFSAPETWFDIVPGLAPGYWLQHNQWRLASAGLHLSASGCLTGSVTALSQWLQHLLQEKTTLARLSAPRKLADGRPTGYGLGISQTQVGNVTLVGHGGSHAGYKSYFLLEPQQKVGLALVANREDVASADSALAVISALLGQPLPQRGHDLTPGLYVAEDGYDWLEVNAQSINWLGNAENLYHSQHPGEAISLSSTFPVRLTQQGTTLSGEIGLAARRFVPANADSASLDAVQGRWSQVAMRSELLIEGNKMTIGIGPAAITASLVSLGNGRLLATAQDGPWQKRFAVQSEGDQLLLALNRSRIIRYTPRSQSGECRPKTPAPVLKG